MTADDIYFWYHHACKKFFWYFCAGKGSGSIEIAPKLQETALKLQRRMVSDTINQALYDRSDKEQLAKSRILKGSSCALQQLSAWVPSIGIRKMLVMLFSSQTKNMWFQGIKSHLYCSRSSRS